MSQSSTKRLEAVPTLPIFAVLFCIALWIRLQKLQTPFFGDQSLYYYLSYTLGFGPASVHDVAPPTAHLVVRPFMYLFFFPWARLSFTAFRLANIVVGAMVPGLVFLLGVKFRANHYLAAAVALIACLHGVLIEYSVKVFPDTLASALMLCGYLAYFSRRARTATVLLVLMALTKEAYALFLVPLVFDSAVRWIRHGNWLIVAPIAGFLAVFITNGCAMFLLHAPMQGWSRNPMGERFMSDFLWTYWCIPFGVILLVELRWQVLGIALAAPLFYTLWGHVLGRGVEQWYTIGPLCVALVAAAVAMQSAANFFQAADIGTRPGGSKWAPVKIFLGRISAAMLVAILIMTPAESGWRDLAKLDTLIDAVTKVPKLERVKTWSAVKVFEKLKPRSLIVVDTFWAYSYYPYGFLTSRVGGAYSHETNDPSEDAQLADVLSHYEAIFWDGNVTKQAKRIRTLLKPCLMYQEAQVAIYWHSQKCLTSLTNK
jgi:hypothetical protein